MVINKFQIREFSKAPKNKKDKNITQPYKDKKVSLSKKKQKTHKNDQSNQAEWKEKSSEGPKLDERK